MTELKELMATLDVLDANKLKVAVTSIDTVDVTPLTFKQQKSLITTGMDGVGGAMEFIKNLNTIICDNTKQKKLKLYDRIPIALALRRELSNKLIEKDDKFVSVDDLVSNFTKFTLNEIGEVIGDGFVVNLRIPSLEEETKIIISCIEELKTVSEDNIGQNISVVLSYEIPKFIKSINFKDKEIMMDELSVIDKNKIIDHLPATITNKITEFIIKFRDYEESLLTFDGVSVDIDSNFFE
jgi:hypothetical protein